MDVWGHGCESIDLPHYNHLVTEGNLQLGRAAYIVFQVSLSALVPPKSAIFFFNKKCPLRGGGDHPNGRKPSLWFSNPSQSIKDFWKIGLLGHLCNTLCDLHELSKLLSTDL